MTSERTPADRPAADHPAAQDTQHAYQPGQGQDNTEPLDVPPWRGRLLLYAVGTALLAFGLRGIARNVNGWTHPTYWAPALVLFALAHDLVLVPLVFAVAVPLGRLVRGTVRPYLAAGLALSGVTLALAWPGLRGYGRLPDNPSVLPLDYAAGLRTTLLILWLVLLAAFVMHALRAELARSRRAASASASARQPEPPPEA